MNIQCLLVLGMLGLVVGINIAPGRLKLGPRVGPPTFAQETMDEIRVMGNGVGAGYGIDEAPRPSSKVLSATIGLSTAMIASFMYTKPAIAISDAAKDALMLLDGYHSVAPYNVTWGILIVGGVWGYFKLYKILAAM